MKAKSKLSTRDDATQVFRQFAWNLAGTLARSKPQPARRVAKPQSGAAAKS